MSEENGGLRSLEGKLLMGSILWSVFVFFIFPSTSRYSLNKCKELEGVLLAPGIDFVDRCKSIIGETDNSVSTILLLISCLLMMGMALAVFMESNKRNKKK